MKQDFILWKLAEIMQWDTEQSRIEFAWLRLMAQMKYDGYQDFLAGARFVESLADWLQQFPSAQERAAAYAFVRKTLVLLQHRGNESFGGTVLPGGRCLAIAADRRVAGEHPYLAGLGQGVVTDPLRASTPPKPVHRAK